MKKIVFFLSAFIVSMLFVHENAEAQKKRTQRYGQMKARSRMISNYVNSYNYPKKARYFSVGAKMGSVHYFGDLAPQTTMASTDFGSTRSNIGVYLQRRYGTQLTLRAGLEHLWIRAEDANSDPSGGMEPRARYLRNLSFYNNVVALSFSGVFEYFKTRPTGYLGRPNINPYAHFGISVFYHNPYSYAPDPGATYNLGGTTPVALYQDLINKGQVTWTNGERINLRELKTEGQDYSAIQFAIPWGLGCNFRLTDKIDLGVEFTYWTLFTDYIDDVSSSFASDKDMRKMSPLAVVMANRSMEPTAALSGDQRTLAQELSALAPGGEVGYLEAYTVDHEGIGPITYYRIDGYENGQAPRGHDDGSDHLMSVNVTATYHFGSALKRPKFRQ